MPIPKAAAGAQLGALQTGHKVTKAWA